MLLSNFVNLVGKMRNHYHRLTEAKSRVSSALRGVEGIDVGRSLTFGYSRDGEIKQPAIFSSIGLTAKTTKGYGCLDWETIIHCDEKQILCEWILWSDNNGEDAERWIRSAYFQDVDLLYATNEAFCTYVEDVVTMYGPDILRFIEEPYTGPDFQYPGSNEADNAKLS